MKSFLFLLTSLLLSLSAFAQDIEGQWNGVLKVQGVQLRLVFNIEKTDSGYKSTMDSPDQAAFGIPVNSTTFQDGTLKITISNARIEYEGTLDKDQIIIGVFTQAGQPFPLNLIKGEITKEESKRPQEPKKPYPYLSEDLTFENSKDGITLAGTLTIPKTGNKFPAVILISGSGPQNRDEELMGHKPFLVLSDYLTRNGIAVLRFDDRGTGKSTGEHGQATSADFANDAEAALEYLKTREEIDPTKIGLAGHSEGGIIAPKVAISNEDVAFLILMAGTGIPGDELLLLQQRMLGKASGMTENQLIENDIISKKAFDLVKNSNNLERDLSDLMSETFRNIPKNQIPSGMTEADFVNAQINQMTNPWMQYFIQYDPAPTLEKVTCPVLAINGSKDLQVAPKENLGAIKSALERGGNNQVTIVEIPELNHLFQESTTGMPSEYASIEQTFSPIAMEEILHWINEQIK
ncbi:alpha/beta fold hydrolase [Algoriphagus lutimaris]|uniref:alpha/beta hydrolase family protein n=1 Tax=Algoriphagus lutimaris TaxID=613197 RepID=UPI00196A983D|nr:alpha/beta hydrolase [Algoriphagus lutimaris]MBN3521596.1 alpha/beta fold hydrolase [Algoriphagus lutimaris]